MKKLLVVDDDPTNLQVMRNALRSDYNLIFANSGESALRAIAAHRPNLVLLDVMMPEMDGYETCRRIRSRPENVDMPVIFVTALGEVEDETIGFDVGAVDYIQKPISAPTLKRRIQTHLSLIRSKALEESHRASIYMLGKAGDYHDEDTGAHIWRMAGYAAAIARSVGWNSELVERIELGAPMHDTGKIGIPASILKAPRKLEPGEWEVMKTHCTIGHQILSESDAPIFQMAAEIALGHHEKWDGSGYPRGCSGLSIPESARIVAVADVFDALTSRRPYKAPWSISDSMREIARNAGTHFDPTIVNAFESILPEIIGIKSKWEDFEQKRIVTV